jgi:hypothetical protein
MNWTLNETMNPGASLPGAINQKLATTCARALEQLTRVKTAIFAEARAAISVPQHLLKLVLNEAEAQSWQTEYPHLVFPALAHEKVQSLSAWSRRQREMYRAPRSFLP